MSAAPGAPGAPGAPPDSSGAAGDAAAFYASIVGALQPPRAPRERWVAGGVRADLLSAPPPAAVIGAAPRPPAAPVESARSRLRATSAAPQIASTNIGFRLLQKAGWREGTGLGAKAQGALEPVETFVKADRRGIGGETVASLEVVGAAPRAPRPPKQAPPKAGADAAGGAGSDAGGGSAAAPQQELSREQLAAFLRKRARDASIQRRIYRDFADAGDGGGGGDANPLLRANKRLRDSNPLRGQWDE